MTDPLQARLSRRALGALGAGVGVAALAGGLPAQAQTPRPRPSRPRRLLHRAEVPALTRSGNHLAVAGRRVRLSGMNAYWVGLNDNDRDAQGRPTFPDYETVDNAFVGLRTLGSSLVRCHTIGMSAGTPRSFSPAPGQFVEAHQDRADYAVWMAARQEIYLMVPLVDQWNYYHGGKGVFVHWAYQQNPDGLVDVPAPQHLFDAHPSEKGAKEEDQFFANTPGGLRIRKLFFDYVTRLLTRVNPYTGMTYAEDPTIAILETGNEVYPATPEWTAAFAALLRELAPNKLIADGSAATDLDTALAPGLGVADIDIVGAHYYAHDPDYNPAPMMTYADQLDADVAAATAAGKIFLIGEYPWTRPDIEQWWAKVRQTPEIVADANWSYIGGQEVHGGPFGSDDYSVHQPFLGAKEKEFGPRLSAHITALSDL